MGCISSKQARSVKSPPAFDSSSSSVILGHNNAPIILDSSLQIHSGSGHLEKIREEPEKEDDDSVKHHHHHHHNGHSGNISKSLKKGASAKRAAFSFRFGRLTESEHVAAGWPTWLSAVAGEAIEGWLPLRSDKFERLEKVINQSDRQNQIRSIISNLIHQG